MDLGGGRDGAGEVRDDADLVCLAQGADADQFGDAADVGQGELLHNGNTQADAAIGGVELSSSEEHGRQVFKERCATCHTLEDAGAVGMVGPNLDDLRPATALTLDAINKGRARGQGQMPAQLVSGPDAQDVAKYVATVSGR